MISGKEYTIDVGAHRDEPLQVSDKSDQNLVKIFLEITLRVSSESLPAEIAL